MKEKRLFGIYHTDCSKDEKRFEELAGSDFVNVFLVEGNYLEKVFSDNFELLKPHPDKGVFVSVSYLGFRTQLGRRRGRGSLRSRVRDAVRF